MQSLVEVKVLDVRGTAIIKKVLECLNITVDEGQFADGNDCLVLRGAVTETENTQTRVIQIRKKISLEAFQEEAELHRSIKDEIGVELVVVGKHFIYACVGEDSYAVVIMDMVESISLYQGLDNIRKGNLATQVYGEMVILDQMLQSVESLHKMGIYHRGITLDSWFFVKTTGGAHISPGHLVNTRRGIDQTDLLHGTKADILSTALAIQEFHMGKEQTGKEHIETWLLWLLENRNMFMVLWVVRMIAPDPMDRFSASELRWLLSTSGVTKLTLTPQIETWFLILSLARKYRYMRFAREVADMALMDASRNTFYCGYRKGNEYY